MAPRGEFLAVTVAIIPPGAELNPDPVAVSARGTATFLPDNVSDFTSLADWLSSVFSIPVGSTFSILGKLEFSDFPDQWLPFLGQLPDSRHLYVRAVLPSADSVTLTRILQKLDALGVEVLATRSSSCIINAEDFDLVCQALKIYGPICEDIDGNSIEGDVLDKMLGNEQFWDERYEEQQRARYCKEVEGWLTGKKLLRNSRWVNGNRETIRRRFDGLHFALSSKNDMVAMSRRFGQHVGQGALLGVELKRKFLTKRSLRQALMEFFLWADASCFPFVQLITDMQKGGVAFYCKRIDAVMGIELRQVVLKDMGEVKKFVSRMGAAFPDDLGSDGPDGLILQQTLGCPPRKKFKQLEKPEPEPGEGSSRQPTGEERATKAQITLWTIGPRFLENEGDVANLADVDSFQQELGEVY